MKKKLREDWLQRVADAMRPKFKAVGCEIPPNVRVSCGFPSGSKKAIGQCWSNTASEGDVFEIFIHPGQADVVAVSATLAHELIHAGVGHAEGHGQAFKRIAVAIGLEGKMTATRAGTEFEKWVAPIIVKAGEYPHKRLNTGTVVGGAKKQTTRLLKVFCHECGYTIRITKQWIEVAVPNCPNDDCSNHGEAMSTEGGE